MKTLVRTLIIIDIAASAAVLYFIFHHSILSSLAGSLFLSAGLFAFRSYDIQYLPSINDQLIRNSSGALFGFLFYMAALSIYGGRLVSAREFISFLLVSIPVYSAVHVVFFHFLKNLVPKKTYFIPQHDYHQLKEILDEIEEKSLGGVTFVTSNDGDPEAAVITTEKQASFDSPAENSVFLPILAEKYLQRIPLEILERFPQYYEVSLSSVEESPAKRVLDIIISIIGLIVFSPIMAIISIAILAEDGLPVIFRQERVGKGSKIFVMYKFRSMKKLENSNTGKFATDEEHRILRIGRFIRKFRLDEVLQFVNVLKGDMSVIGPRPEQKELAEKFSALIPAYSFRQVRKPGITGWAQLMYKYAASLEETKIKLSYDLWYVKNRNIFLDLRIILQTLEAILFRRGAK